MSRRFEVPVLQRSVESANEWIDALTGELGVEDRHHGYRVLRAFLHALRDRLTVEEAAQLASQMPELIRGIYYENWVPSRTPQKYRDAATFLSRISEEAGLHGNDEASYAAAAAYKVLCARITEGEIEDVLAVLPAGVRTLLTETAGGPR